MTHLPRFARSGSGRLPVRTVAVLAAVVLAFTSCLRDPDPIDLDDRALTVHAVLEAGSESVVVVLSRPAPAGDPWVTYEGVSDADVRLIAGTDTTWLVETPQDRCVNIGYREDEPDDGLGCYRASLPAPLAYGATYRLEARLPDGTTVTGATTTPDAVPVRAPTDNLRVTARCGDSIYCFSEPMPTPPYNVPISTIPVAWDRPASVGRVSLRLRPVVVYLGEAVYPGSVCDLGHLQGELGFARDSIDWYVANIYCGTVEAPEVEPARFDSIRAELIVFGWNDHYARYAENSTGQGVRDEAASQGLEGAYGVFGAIARTTRSVVLVRDPPPGVPGG